MQFIVDGPDIPVEVLRAHEEGRLVFFCGAGISIPAGLPSFRGLVERLYNRLGVTPSPEEQRELGASQPGLDRVLNLLEGPGRFSPSQVRREVAAILATPADPDLDTHLAILKLSRTRADHFRLVTTNFDLLFQAAEPNVRCTAAPLLPVPKPHKWDHLVYLHGRLDEADPNGAHLVLTSADFGTAYLVERWASRFVSELFRHFTVLFIGYAVDDPPMRYLIDAIAAERRLDESVRPAFALVGYAPGGRNEATATWAAKGITPILYENSGHHTRLHRTLREWGRLWAGGLGSKLSLVTELAQMDPAALPAEALSQFCWAISDESGAMAAELGRLGPSAPLAWLEVLEKAELLSGPAFPGSIDKVALVDDGHTTGRIPPLDPVRRGLARWLATHAGDPQLARWVVKKGSRLHPELAELVRSKLRDDRDLSAPLRKVWLALSGGVRLQERPNAYDRLGLYGRISAEKWGPVLRADVKTALAPCLALRKSWTSVLAALDGEESDTFEGTVGSILSFDCELAAGNDVQMMLEQLAARADWSAILSDLAFDLTNLLREALDFLAALDGASEDYDPSYIQHPSIAPHEQNNDLHGWTRLIDLVRDAFEALRESDPKLASALVRLWSSIPYPLFRRLVLYAFRAEGSADAPDLLRVMASDPANWLWSTATQAELFATLPVLWAGLGPSAGDDLVDLVLAGPPRETFREDLGQGEWEQIRDRSIWERLARLRRSGAALTAAAASRLGEIEADHPAWQLTGDEREDFPTWMESGWGLPTDFSAEALLGLTDDEIVRVLEEHEANREGLLDSWRLAAQTDLSRAISLLARLQRNGFFDTGVWSHGVGALRDAGNQPELKEKLVALLEGLPDGLLREEEIGRVVADALRGVARDLPDTLRPRLLDLWDSAFAHALGVEARSSHERVTDAINHPAGMLAEALLDVLRSRPLERGSGIDGDVQSRLERIVRAEAPAASVARVIVASRLPLLHDLDPAWTRDTVIPWFDWQRPDEAQGVWQGFLWSPWLRPSLWAVLKPHFIATFDHVDALGRSRQSLAALLASVCVEGRDSLSRLEARECLRKLGPEGRESVAIWLGRKLKGAGPQASTLWRDSIGPWLATAWPREPGLRDAHTSERLAWISTLAGDAFPEAAQTVSELAGHVEHARMILDAIRSEGLVSRAPEACLALISALTPDNPPPWFGPLGDVVGQIVQARPELSEDPRLRRLRDTAIRRRL